MARMWMGVSPNPPGQLGDVRAHACAPPRHGAARPAPVHLAFLWTKSHTNKCKLHLRLKLFPNISDVLEQIHSFTANVIAEVTVFWCNLSDRLLLILLASGSSLHRVFRGLCEIPV